MSYITLRRQVFPICLLLLTGGAAALAVGEHAKYPEAQEAAYRAESGREYLYLIQEPDADITTTATNVPAKSILIYLHGAGGKEEQGMQLFPRLRQLLNRMGWIYVCPRDYEYKGLIQNLKAHYGDLPIYLSGASAGGFAAFKESLRHPERYAGVILMCPAILMSRLEDFALDQLHLPLWLVCGDRDRYYIKASRHIAKAMQENGKRINYVEIPGGDHSAPCREIQWPEALRFVTGKERLVPRQ